MSLKCECGALVRAENVNIAAAVASCPTCGAVFSIAQKTPPPAVIPDAFVASRDDDAHAGGYRDRAERATARWQFRWFRWQHAAMVPFFLFWDCVCGTFVVGSIRGAGVLGWLVLLVPHVWVGVIGTYWTLAHLLNRTTVTLDADALRVSSGPVPWRRKTIARAGIVGFDVGTHAFLGTRTNGPSRWKVRAIGSDRRGREIIGSLSEEEAAYLAAELGRAIDA